MTIKESQTLNEKQGQEIKVSCLRCDGETCHKVLFSVEQTSEEVGQTLVEIGKFNFVPSDSIFTWYDYQIIQCQGCKTISFRQTSSSSEDYYPEFSDECYVYETIYPSRIKDKKGLEFEKLCLLPPQTGDIYTETLQALNSVSPILVGIGLRALVESVCSEKSAKGGNLSEKIDDLKENNILTPANAEILHKIRTLGNDAAHEVKKHKEHELELAMNVVEHLLTDVYILPQQAKKLPQQAKKLLLLGFKDMTMDAKDVFTMGGIVSLQGDKLDFDVKNLEEGVFVEAVGYNGLARVQTYGRCGAKHIDFSLPSTLFSSHNMSVVTEAGVTFTVKCNYEGQTLRKKYTTTVYEGVFGGSTKLTGFVGVTGNGLLRAIRDDVGEGIKMAYQEHGAQAFGTAVAIAATTAETTYTLPGNNPVNSLTVRVKGKRFYDYIASTGIVNGESINPEIYVI